MTLLIVGDPVNGFKYFGPFATPDAAIAFAENTAEADWWISTLPAG